MINLPEPAGYCIDTSAIIKMWREVYFPKIFPSLWKEIGILIDKRILISSMWVYRELHKKSDEIFEWAKIHKIMFENENQTQVNYVRKIMNKFQTLVDREDASTDADPYIIALAMDKNYKLITSETKTFHPTKTKIPEVCNHYNVICLSPTEFIYAQDWKF